MFRLLAKSSAKLLSPRWQSLNKINLLESLKAMTLAVEYALSNRFFAENISKCKQNKKAN